MVDDPLTLAASFRSVFVSFLSHLPTPASSCLHLQTNIAFLGLSHKYFVSFIAYAFIGCLSVCIISLPTFLEVVGESTRSAAPSSKHGATLASPNQFDSQVIGPAPIFTAVFVIGYILTSAFAFALCGFVLFHAYLVYKGRTTIEMCDIVDPARAGAIARFDLGGRANCLAVFGHLPLCWAFPTRYGIEGDGLTYQRSSCYPGARDGDVTCPERV
jgi:DHHC palmitoyltransferase